jgi:Domain of unknown function (DUF6766)
VKTFLRNNGLSLVMFGLFCLFLAGQTFTGLCEHNEDQKMHGRPLLSLRAYLLSGHYLEAVFENWESEFLQMAAYVIFTVLLFQKGSSESKDPDKANPVDEDPRRHRQNPNAPWAVRKGGFRLVLYEHSLSLAFFALFLISFLGHLIGGSHHYNEERAEHGQPALNLIQYLGTARFWFESFQNWQSEFLAVFAIVFLSIWLRERGSPESKPVAAPHRTANL